MVRCGSRTFRQTRPSSWRTSFDSGQHAPGIERISIREAGFKLDHVVAAEASDEIVRRAFGDDLAVVDDGEAVAEALGFVHVMRGQQNGAAFLLKGADGVPELAAALRIEPGGGLIEKQNFWVADQRSGDGQALALASGKLAHPGIGLLGELHFFKDFLRRAWLRVEAGEEVDGFADSELFGEARLLQRDAELLA